MSMFKNYVIFRQEDRKKDEAYFVGFRNGPVFDEHPDEAEHFATARGAYQFAGTMAEKFPMLLDCRVGLR